MIETLLDLDRRLFVLLNQQLVSSWLDAPVRLFTDGKILQMVALVCLAAAVWRLRLRAVPLIAGLLTAVAISNSASDLVKSVVNRPRPFVTEDGARVLVGRGRVASFPSSHAANAAAIAFTAMGLLGFGSWRRTLLVGGLGLMALWVGWSRVYVGAHFPADILTGWALGAGAAGLAVLLWRKVPPLTYLSPPGRLRLDVYHLAIVLSVVFAVFRLAFVVTNDQGLTPGEALPWHLARYPLAFPPGSSKPFPAFLPTVLHWSGAIYTADAAFVRWPMPIIGLMSILMVLWTLRQIGLGRSMAGMLVVFLQTVPAVNAAHVWFLETTFIGLAWITVLGGWALWNLHHRPAGLILMTSALVLSLLDFSSFLVIMVAVWMLEHYRGDYSSRRAKWSSVLFGIVLLLASLTVRFTRAPMLQPEVWSWSLLSVLGASGPGTVVLAAVGLVLLVRFVVITRLHQPQALGLRLRVVLLYCLGTALAGFWLGNSEQIAWVVLVIVPAALLASQYPIQMRNRGVSALTPIGKRLLGITVLGVLVANATALFLIYDKDTVRNLPGNRIEARWLTGWPDRMRPLSKALQPEDRVAAADPMTAAILSHAIERPVDLLLPPTVGPAGRLEFTVRQVDGTTVPLRRQVVAVSPWAVSSMSKFTRRWNEAPVGLQPASGDLPTTLSLDKHGTLLMQIYLRSPRATQETSTRVAPLNNLAPINPVEPDAL